MRCLYTENNGQQYATNYIEKDIEDFYSRMRDIYVPKAQFLKDSLLEYEQTLKGLSLCDFGAGAGYFVGANKEMGFTSVVGYGVSKALVRFGNHVLGGLLYQHELEETTEIVEKVEAEVISFIGVLEHTRELRSILDAIRKNPSIRYIFFSVPLFSPTVVLETVFTNIMPRHLVAGHTHLYTETSIDYFCKEFGFKKISEWWFGLDFADFYRSILVSLELQKSEVSVLVNYWKSQFAALIDDLQQVLDRNHLCSEVHMLVRKMD